LTSSAKTSFFLQDILDVFEDYPPPQGARNLLGGPAFE
jgi:hypothetical protein